MAPDGQRDLWRLQINMIPVMPAQERELRATLPQVRASDVLPLLSTARLGSWRTGASDVNECNELPGNLDEAMLPLVRRLQVQATSGPALELLTPKLDGIRDPALRMQFASVVFDMMHVRGRYEDAAGADSAGIGFVSAVAALAVGFPAPLEDPPSSSSDVLPSSH